MYGKVGRQSREPKFRSISLCTWLGFDVERGALANEKLLNIFFSSSVDHVILAPPITEPGMSSLPLPLQYIDNTHTQTFDTPGLPRRMRGVA